MMPTTNQPQTTLTPTRFDCESWEVKLLLRLRQLRQRRQARQVLIDLATLQLQTVGGPETLEKVTQAENETPA